MNSTTFETAYGKISVYENLGYIDKVILNSFNDLLEPTTSLLTKAKKQIMEFLSGSRKSFDLPIQLKGSSFRKDVLKAISNISLGMKLSYQELAKKSGHPKAIRAVGTVCSRNKLPLIIPCHRVIRSDGIIGNYQGGIEMKKSLLSLETIQQK